MTVLSCRFLKVILLSTFSFVSTRVYQSYETIWTLISQFVVSTPHTAKSCSFHFFRVSFLPWNWRPGVDEKLSRQLLNQQAVLLRFLCTEMQLLGLWASHRRLISSSSSTGGTDATTLSPWEFWNHFPCSPQGPSCCWLLLTSLALVSLQSSVT